MHGLRVLLVPGVCLVASACGGKSGEEAAPRSPTLDYPLAPAQTSDGEVVGADRQAPADKLATGARAGSGGVVPSGPGGHEAVPTKKPAPCQDIGLEDANGKSRCAPAAAPAK